MMTSLNSGRCLKPSGQALLHCPKYNKDLAFKADERESGKLKGLLPVAVRSLEQQASIEMECLGLLGDNPLAKYMYLRDLQDRNRVLFYKVLISYATEVMPLVYTPTVGLACQQYSLLVRRPRGLFVAATDAGRVAEVLSNYTIKDVRAIVVTDGERILGLGDLGANGMGIPVGKIALYTSVGGVAPELTLPVTLDVGTNNEALLASPHYIGLKQKRITGPQYDRLVDEFMEAVIKRWGRQCLIQFEDFGNKNAFRLLAKYQDRYCTFNDDIQGTASVAVAGVLASLKVISAKVSDLKYLFLGAGEAALGIADLLVMQMTEEGLSNVAARSRIYLIDSKGLVTADRPRGDAHKDSYAAPKVEMNSTSAPLTDLLTIVEHIRPNVLIGASAQPGAFTPAVLAKMAELNAVPVIFSLSNPTSKSECTAEAAYTNTKGRALFASGSPYDKVTAFGRTFTPGQGNNLYVYPAVACAVVHCRVATIPPQCFLVAATALASLVSLPDILQHGSLYPPMANIRATSLKVASKVAEWFYAKGLANVKPEPSDKEQFLASKLYEPAYV